MLSDADRLLMLILRPLLVCLHQANARREVKCLMLFNERNS
jgi:hypothetical protein